VWTVALLDDGWPSRLLASRTYASQNGSTIQMPDLPLSELLTFAAYLCAAGIIAGILAGLFGIGGGTVLVPAFYEVFGAVNVPEEVRMHLALGSSMAIVVSTSIRSFRAHHQRGTPDIALLRSWIRAVPLGVLAAALIVSSISSFGLRFVFAIISVIVGLKLLLSRDSWRLGDHLPENPIRFVVGASIGLVSTLMGIGGGVLNNTFMTLFGRAMHQAVGTSAGVGVLIAIPAMLGYVWAGWGRGGLPPYSTGFVNWMTVLLIIPLTLIVTPYGVRLAHALSRQTLERTFGAYMLFVAARFFWSLA
jgi:uncharacterized protein